MGRFGTTIHPLTKKQVASSPQSYFSRWGVRKKKKKINTYENFQCAVFETAVTTASLPGARVRVSEKCGDRSPMKRQGRCGAVAMTEQSCACWRRGRVLTRWAFQRGGRRFEPRRGRWIRGVGLLVKGPTPSIGIGTAVSIGVLARALVCGLHGIRCCCCCCSTTRCAGRWRTWR